MALIKTITALGAAFMLHSHLAVAAPTSSCSSGIVITDTFEDVPTTPIVGEVTPELGTAPPKPYHGLGYNYVTVDNLTVTNLKPESGTNGAVLFITNDVKAGIVTANPFFTITALPGTVGGAKSFDLLDFYFGCILDTAQDTVNVASACTISVAGYKTTGQKTGELTYSFGNTQLAASNPLVKADVAAQSLLVGYTGLANVTITIIDATPVAANGVLFVDNVQHINHC